MDTSLITSEEESTLTALMQKLPDTFGYELFCSVAGKFVLPAVEALIFREFEGKKQTLLIKREVNDHIWPELWHNPGTIIRKSDFIESGLLSSRTLKKCFERLENKEIKGKFKSDPKFKNIFIDKTKRGVGLHLLFECEVESFSEGKFFDLDNLPKNRVGNIERLLKM